MKGGRKKNKKRKKRGVKGLGADNDVAAQQRVPIEEVASKDLAEWDQTLEGLMGKIKSKIIELKPVDKEALEMFETLRRQREKYLVGLANRYERQENGEKLGLDEKISAQKDLDEIKADDDELLLCAREKIQIATESYDIVDEAIGRLDAVIARLDEKYPSETKILRETHEQKLYKENLKQQRRSRNMGGTGSGRFAEREEPKYCICQSAAHGDMIGCDHEACEKEWFHLTCVGLKKAPSDGKKWYCPECTELYGDPNKPRRGRKRKGR